VELGTMPTHIKTGIKTGTMPTAHAAEPT